MSATYTSQVFGIAPCTALTLLLGACASPNGTYDRADNNVTQEYCEEQFSQQIEITDKLELIDRVVDQGIFKNDFETKAEYIQRISTSLPEFDQTDPPIIFVKWKLDPEFIRYDADTQALIIKEFAVSNLSPDMPSLFGYGSRVAQSGINIQHSMLADQLSVTFDHREELAKSYIGQNAFGATAAIQQLNHYVSGVLEREGKFGESIWGFDNGSWYDPKDIGMSAFTVSLPSDQARELKENTSVILSMKMKYPFYAEGEKHYEARITNPYQHSYFYRYLIADMQCMALVDSNDEVVTIRSLR